MRYINDLTITGRAGRDASHNATPSGQNVVNVPIAYTERRQDQGGNWVDGDTTWFDVALWDERAAEIARTIRKGDLVVVTGGRVKLREYERRDGTPGASIAVTATHLAVSVQPSGKPQQAGGSWSNAPAGDFDGGTTGSPWTSSGGDAQGEGEPPF